MMADGRILALGAYDAWDVTALREAFEPAWARSEADLRALPEAERSGVTALVFKGQAFGAAEMDLLPALRLVANYGVGTDHIDLDAAAARGIAVSNTPDVLTDDVADLAVAMMLAFTRNLVPNADWIAQGRWPEGQPPLARTLGGARAGILGLGRIGRAIADRLAAFGMEIHFWSRSPKDVPAGWTAHADATSLAGGSDYLVVALVGGAETEGLVDAGVIAALGADGVLVNIARGSVVEEAALLDALETEGLRGAALDVFHGEPKIDPRFLALTNVVLQPHQGSATVETRKAMGALQRANVAAFFAGEALPTPVG